MDGLSRPIGAPLPLRFDGKMILLRPLTLADFGAIERYIVGLRPRVYESALAAAEHLPLAMRDAARQAAAKAERARQSVSINDLLKFITSTVDGVSLAAWLMLRRAEPGRYSFDDIRTIITTMAERSPAELQSFILAFLDCSGLTDASQLDWPADSHDTKPAKQINWKHIIYRLTLPPEAGGRGMRLADVSALTLFQLRLLNSSESDVSGVVRMSPAAWRQMMAAKGHKLPPPKSNQRKSAKRPAVSVRRRAPASPAESALRLELQNDGLLQQ